MPVTPFSRLYCPSSETLRDSVRMRNRLGSYCLANFGDRRPEIVKLIERETGSRVPWVGQRQSLDRFFQSAELRDCLDAITLIADYFGERRLAQDRILWTNFASRVLREEGTAYVLDKSGEVHFAIDANYAANRAEVISGLAGDRWTLARQELEHAFSEMDAVPPRTNSAIRSVAAAVETISKSLVVGGVARIGPTEIERNLWPLVERKYAGDDHAKNAGHCVLKSYSDWVNATHQYRHGQSEADGAVATEALAVWVLTSGASIARWLISELVEPQ